MVKNKFKTAQQFFMADISQTTDSEFLYKFQICLYFFFVAGLLIQAPGTPLDACRMTPYVAMPPMREPIDRLPPMSPFLPYYPLHGPRHVPQPIHPLLLYHHHYAAALNYASLHDNGVKSNKNSSIADLRLKARQHLASLGIWSQTQCDTEIICGGY
jgi:hypothetical protein